MSQRQQKEKNILKIDGKEFIFKKSDIKLFDRLKYSVDEIGRAFQKSGKIPDSERKTVLNDMTESCLSVMILLHDILSSTLDVKCHSVRRVTNTSQATGQCLLSVFVTAGSTGRTQPWLSWEIMSAYSHLSLHHGKVIRRLNGAIISALRKATCNLEGHREKVNNLDDYLVEIIQVEENIRILIDKAATLQLEESQISQLHNLLKRVNTLLERKRPQS